MKLKNPFCLFVEVWYELTVLHLQVRPSTICVTPPVHFALVILEMGVVSLKLFVQAGLKPQSF
jgi:hypothetical protein